MTKLASEAGRGPTDVGQQRVPLRFGFNLLDRYRKLAATWRERIQGRIACFFPTDPGPTKEASPRPLRPTEEANLLA
jgi:hypothetical protein